MQQVRVTHFTDPGCPWAWSAAPALATLRWRFGDQLDWRLVLIGLTESAQQYADRGYTPLASARGQARFRRWGMPFSPVPKRRLSATSRACRTVVAARMEAPALGDAVLRALQLAQFTTPAVLDDDDDLRAALRDVPGVDADALVGRIDDPAVVGAYEADRALARSAAGGATEAQGKAARTDGPVRFTAPSLVLERGETRVEAGGFQPVEAYDVVLANLDPSLERRPAPDDPVAALEEVPGGLTTAEVAEILRSGNFPAERGAAEAALLGAVAAGDAVRVPAGDDAVWVAARHARPAPSRFRRAVAAA